MRILYLVPRRAEQDPNTTSESDALRIAGHDVIVEAAPSRAPLGTLRLSLIAKSIVRTWNPDAVMARDLDTLGPAVFAAQAAGAKLVYFPHDVYQYMVESDVSRLVFNYLVKYERRLIPKIDVFIASNPGIIDWLNEQASKDGIGIDDPITLVMPCRDPQPFRPPVRTLNIMAYLGTLHKNRFIKEMIRATKVINDAGRITAWLVIAGPRTNNLYRWVRRNATLPVVFLGHIPPDEVAMWTRNSNLVVSMLNPADRNLRIGLANKVFDAMSFGRAAIGTTGTATGDLINKTRMGLTVEYDIDSYIRGVRQLLSQDLIQLGRNAYSACVQEFNWNNQARQLIDVFRRIE